MARSGLTDLLQLSSVVNLILWFTASGAHRCIVLMILDFRPTAAGGCDLVEFATRRFSLGRARREQRSHLPLRAWVDFTCARNDTVPTGNGLVAI